MSHATVGGFTFRTDLCVPFSTHLRTDDLARTFYLLYNKTFHLLFNKTFNSITGVDITTRNRPT